MYPNRQKQLGSRIENSRMCSREVRGLARDTVVVNLAGTLFSFQMHSPAYMFVLRCVSCSFAAG